MGVCSTIGTSGRIEDGVRLSLDLFFQGEVDIVCGCILVSTSFTSATDTPNIRGVGMLSMIAAEKRPDALGDINIARTAAAPAL